MKHFNVVLGLCRSAMKTGNPAIEKHIQRLVKELEKEGDLENAKGLKKLISSGRKKAVELSPSRVVMSRAALSGENLTPAVKPPLDKETQAPLAEILQPDQLEAVSPIFVEDLEVGIGHLLEEWKHVDKLRKRSINPALTSMLFGAPGTGKTMLAHFIAQELQLPLITARLDGLISSFLGTTARNISTLFAFANRYKCILLLDEFDAVAKLRDDPHELGEIKRVVNTLLQCIDSRASHGFTLAITNHESLLDPAVWRRFDIRIEVGLPDFDVRAQIFRRLFAGYSPSEEEINFLAWVTEGETGSDIDKLFDFIARQRAILDAEFNFLNSVRSYILFSAQENESPNRQLALGEPETLVMALTHQKEFAWGQEQLAGLFNCAQSTISRWLRKESALLEIA